MGYAAFGEYKTYYEKLGSSGPAVLLVHGIGGGSSVFQYRKNAQALVNAGYRVWAIDLLGFGRSTRPVIRYTNDLHRSQIASFIRDQIKEPVLLIANGVAGAYSIRLSVEQPELVNKLVLIGPTGLERQVGPPNGFLYGLLNSWIGELVFAAFVTPQGQRFFLDQAYYSEASYTPEVVETYDYNLKVSGGQYVVYSFASSNLSEDVRPYWPKVSQPVLLLWGEAGGYTDATDAKAFTQARPDVKSVVIPQSRLLPNEDNPEAFNGLLLEFLK